MGGLRAGGRTRAIRPALRLEQRQFQPLRPGPAPHPPGRGSPVKSLVLVREETSCSFCRLRSWLRPCKQRQINERKTKASLTRAAQTPGETKTRSDSTRWLESSPATFAKAQRMCRQWQPQGRGLGFRGSRPTGSFQGGHTVCLIQKEVIFLKKRLNDFYCSIHPSVHPATHSSIHSFILGQRACSPGHGLRSLWRRGPQWRMSPHVWLWKQRPMRCRDSLTLCSCFTGQH